MFDLQKLMLAVKQLYNLYTIYMCWRFDDIGCTNIDVADENDFELLLMLHKLAWGEIIK